VGLATAMELVRGPMQADVDPAGDRRESQLKLSSWTKRRQLRAPDRPQQRRDPRRALLQAGQPEGPDGRRGSRLMIGFCQEHNLPYELCGKVVVPERGRIAAPGGALSPGTANGVCACAN